MKSQEIQIQKILIEYFKDFDDETLVKIIDSFVYEIGTDDERISKIIEKFLSDNLLTDTYCNYISDKTSKSSFFKCSRSELQMIDYLKNGFLNLAYNRLRISVYDLKLEKIKNNIAVYDLKLAKHEATIAKCNLRIKEIENDTLINEEKQKTKKDKKQKEVDYKRVKLRFDDDSAAEVHMIIGLNENYTLCGILIDGDYTHDVEINSTEKISCQHCLNVINQCKATKI